MSGQRSIRFLLTGCGGLFVLATMGFILLIFRGIGPGILSGPPSPDEITIAEPQTVNERHAELVRLLEERVRRERVEYMMAPTSRAGARHLWLLPITWKNQYGGDALAVDARRVRTVDGQQVGLAIWQYPDETLCLVTTWQQQGNSLWYVEDYAAIPDCHNAAEAEDAIQSPVD
jgi:hypothetical protein